MDRLNQLKFNPFSLNNDNIALNENNVNLDMVNNLNTTNCNYTPNKYRKIFFDFLFKYTKYCK
jgi:hypothetical protein